MENLKKEFLERGYPCHLVEENLQRGAAIPRADLLKPNPVYPQQDCPTLLSKPRFSPAFIVTYNPHNPNLHKWLKDNHHILLADKKMAKIFPTPPSVSYRQPRRLKQQMMRSRLKALPLRDCSYLQSKPAGCYRHQHGTRGRRCELCPRLIEGVVMALYCYLTYSNHKTSCMLSNLRIAMQCAAADSGSHFELSSRVSMVISYQLNW